MSLSAGDKLGPYEILAKIGAGGMGEVYRAHDPRLRRDVAIKVSAERFSERFEREAHAVAALNHPNICSIYDVGPNYIVMEYIEGEAPKGPLPLEEALRLARQIGDALEEAHGKGVVHRDLKPANIKIKPDGTVKVLDFGLAKHTPDNDSSLGEDSPTLSMAATQAGVILGTAGYMSPEQARGKRVDKRADIWAFGVVLYELLAGRRLFQGEDVSHTMAAVIMQEPNLDAVPSNVQRLLRKCLQKEPKNRLRDIGDAWELLEEPSQPAPSPSRLGSTPAWIAAAVAMVIAGVALWAPWRAEKPSDRPLVRLDVDLGADVSLAAINAPPPTIAISPDGTRLAYVANPSTIFVRRLDQAKATELPGTRGASMPFFSPDSQWVGFRARNKLNKISVEGGAVVTLADSTTTAGASWGEDGQVFLPLSFGKGLFRVPSAGGQPIAVTEAAKGELIHYLPQVLPGGKAVLFVSVSSPDDNKNPIEVVTVADRRRKIVMMGGTSPRYLSSGHLLYTNKSTLFAVPFDLDKLETRGTAVPILDDVALYQVGSGSQYDVSRNGTLVYRRADGQSAAGMTTIQWVDSAGKQEPLLGKPAVYLNPRLSPDGKLLAVSIEDGSGRNIWIYDPQRDASRRLTSAGVNDAPVWSPDGRYIAFTSPGNGIMWTRSDGAGQPQLLIPNVGLTAPWSFAPDGKRLAYVDVTGSAQIWTVPLDDQGGQLKAGKPEQFLKSQFNDQDPVFSPDGRWLAYQSNKSGRPEVYVRAFPDKGGEWQISNSVGRNPVWSRNGRDLLYRSGADGMMVVTYTVKGEAFEADKPRVWIAKVGGVATSLTLAPDGKRIAAVMPVDAPEGPKQDHEVVFVQNFFDELRRRVPIPK